MPPDSSSMRSAPSVASAGRARPRRRISAESLRQPLDQAPDADDLAPVVALQQPAQPVPVRVLEKIAHGAQDTDQLVDEVALLLPVVGERGQRPRDGCGRVVAAVDVVDDAVEVPEHRCHDLVGEFRALAAQRGEPEPAEDRAQGNGQLPIRPIRARRVGQHSREQRCAQSGERIEPGLERALRVDEASQPEVARQAVERRQPCLAVLEQRRAGVVVADHGSRSSCRTGSGAVPESTGSRGSAPNAARAAVVRNARSSNAWCIATSRDPMRSAKPGSSQRLCAA